MEASATNTQAKAQDAKTEKAGEEDLSMEEILQSIRRIIAEDDSEGKKPVADTAKANGQKTKGAKDDVPGSEVLELTEMVKDDGTVVSLKPDAAKPAASGDVLNKIDEALTPKADAAAPAKAEDKPAEKPAEKPPEKPAEPVAAAPAAPAEPAAPPAAAAPPPPPPAPVAPATTTVAATADSLLSSEAAAAAAAAFKKAQISEPEVPAPATTPSPAFSPGVTMEDLVRQMLQPMMKNWLDANLPSIVERIVEREVKKLTRQ